MKPSRFEDPLVQIRVAVWTAVFVVSFSILCVVAGILKIGGMEKYFDAWALIDIAIFAALTYGLHRRNLVSAVLLLAYWVLSRVYNVFVLDLAASGYSVSVALLLTLGVRGVIDYRRTQKRSEV